jgi:hypothetical protein
MKTAFLICALALPNGTWSAVKEYKILEEMLQEMYPNHDIILVNKDEQLLNNYTLHTPLIYKGMRVYLRKSA